jgi:hypothetical protein
MVAVAVVAIYSACREDVWSFLQRIKKEKKVNTISFWFKYRDTITMQMRKNLIVRYKWYNMEWLSEYNHLRLIAKENAIEAPKLLTIFWTMKNSGDTLFLKVPCLKESKF